jgi:hypothetical protein
MEGDRESAFKGEESVVGQQVKQGVVAEQREQGQAEGLKF